MLKTSSSLSASAVGVCVYGMVEDGRGVYLDCPLSIRRTISNYELSALPKVLYMSESFPAISHTVLPAIFRINTFNQQ